MMTSLKRSRLDLFCQFVVATKINQNLWSHLAAALYSQNRLAAGAFSSVLSTTATATMPESNAAAKKRIQKQNRALGIGDEQGRLVRVKDPPKMSQCTVCQMEMRITKTNTELTAHATSKHGSTLEECFPGAKETAEEMVAALSKDKGGDSGASGPTKAQRKAKTAAGMDDLLNAGLSAGKKKGKK